MLDHRHLIEDNPVSMRLARPRTSTFPVLIYTVNADLRSDGGSDYPELFDCHIAGHCFIECHPPLSLLDALCPQSSTVPCDAHFTMITFYSIEDILNIAHIHPFYTSSVAYPPDPDEIALALKGKDGRSSALLSTQPLLSKEKL